MSSDSKWKINWRTAVLIGTPVALLGVAGVWYYRRTRTPHRTPEPVPRPVTPQPEDPKTQSISKKNLGNKYFKGGRYDLAIKCYTEAMELCPTDAKEDRATFYQNRAAAHENLKQWKEALSDCNHALELLPRYLKALNRRARVHENLSQLEDCLQDVTAACILEKFSNQENLTRADRVLKLLGEKKAAEELASHRPSLPSDSVITTYFSAFASDPFFSNPTGHAPPLKSNGSFEVSASDESGTAADVEADTAPAAEHGENEEGPVHDESEIESIQFVPESPQPPPPGVELLTHAVERLLVKEYAEAMRLAEESASQLQTMLSGIPSPPEYLSYSLTRALLLRATFHILSGQHPKAKADLDVVVNNPLTELPVRVNALIKMASVLMASDQDIVQCMETLHRAMEVSPECPDIYHHRGQIYLLADKLDEAKADMDRAVELKPTYTVAQAQRLYVHYRWAMSQENKKAIDKLMNEFKTLCRSNPQCIETHSIYAQVLSEQNKFEESDAAFVRVIELAPSSGTAYVHRGMLQLKWKGDQTGAERMIQQAVEHDPKCEFAYEMLATLAVQRCDFQRALELFNSAVQLTKTRLELAHVVSLREAVHAQMKACEVHGISPDEMRQLLTPMAGLM